MSQRPETREPFAGRKYERKNCRLWPLEYLQECQWYAEDSVRESLLRATRDDSRQALQRPQHRHLDPRRDSLRHDCRLPTFWGQRHKQALQEDSVLWLPHAWLPFIAGQRPNKTYYTGLAWKTCYHRRYKKAPMVLSNTVNAAWWNHNQWGQNTHTWLDL